MWWDEYKTQGASQERGRDVDACNGSGSEVSIPSVLFHSGRKTNVRYRSYILFSMTHVRAPRHISSRPLTVRRLEAKATNPDKGNECFTEASLNLILFIFQPGKVRNTVASK